MNPVGSGIVLVSVNQGAAGEASHPLLIAASVVSRGAAHLLHPVSRFSHGSSLYLLKNSVKNPQRKIRHLLCFILIPPCFPFQGSPKMTYSYGCQEKAFCHVKLRVIPTPGGQSPSQSGIQWALQMSFYQQTGEWLGNGTGSYLPTRWPGPPSLLILILHMNNFSTRCTDWPLAPLPAPSVLCGGNWIGDWGWCVSRRTCLNRQADVCVWCLRG